MLHLHNLHCIWAFAGLLGVCLSCGGSDSTTAPGDQTPPNQFTITLTGAGNGLVTSADAAIACGLINGSPTSKCSTTLRPGASLTLTAEATGDGRSYFAGWGGACANTSGLVCVVVGSQAKGVTVDFERGFVLTADGQSKATYQSVHAWPISPNCPAARTDECWGSIKIYPPNAQVTVAIDSTAVGVFMNWSGDCIGTQTQRVITMTGDKTVHGIFAPDSLQVRVEFFPVYAAPSLTTTVVGRNGAKCSLRAGSCAIYESQGYIGGDTVSVIGAPGPAVRWLPIIKYCTASPIGPFTAIVQRFWNPGLSGYCPQQLFIEGPNVLTVHIATNLSGNAVVTLPNFATPDVGCTLAHDCVIGLNKGEAVVVTAFNVAKGYTGTWSGACTGRAATPCTLSMTGSQDVTLNASPTPSP